MDDIPADLISLSQAARHLGISRTAVYALIRREHVRVFHKPTRPNVRFVSQAEIERAARPRPESTSPNGTSL